MCMSGGVVRKNSSQATASDPSTGTLATRASAIGRAAAVPAAKATDGDPERERHAQEQPGDVADDGVETEHAGLEFRSVR